MQNKQLEDFIIDQTLQRVSVHDMYLEAKKQFNYEWSQKTFRNFVGKVRRRNKQKLIDIAINDPEHTLKLKIEVQRLRDKVRINEALIRKFGRVNGMIEESFDIICEKMKGLSPENFFYNRYNEESFYQKLSFVPWDRTIIAQVTDLHANEIIVSSDTCGYNIFDFKKLSCRLCEYARIIKLNKMNCTDLYVAFTGDLFNSDRRMDEMLKSQGTRAEAVMVLAQVLAKFLGELSQSFNVKVVSVLGNESRMEQNVPLSNPLNNFDYLIHKFLQVILRDASPCIKFHDVSKPIVFKDIEKNYEQVIEVYDAHILLTHNYHNLTWDKAIKKYNALGIILDYMITGHGHQVNIRENTAQSGSLVGTNFYGFFGLHSPAKASQNIYLIDKKFADKKPSISVVNVDLQDVNDDNYYDFIA